MNPTTQPMPRPGWGAPPRTMAGALFVGAGLLFGPVQAHAEFHDACTKSVPAGDAESFYEIVQTAVTPSQLSAMMSGIGEVGRLADGSGRDAYELPSGIRVPAAGGTQPLERKPLPPLPMPDNPGLLDELASGGVHSDGYNSSTSPLPGPTGLNPLATTTSVHDEEIRACTPLLRDLEGHLASLCISLFTRSELVLFDPSDGFKILAKTAIPARSGLIDPAGGWYTRMDHLGRPLVPTATQKLRAYRAVAGDEGYAWIVDREWDLSGTLPAGMSATDVIPGFDGGYWFITGYAHVGHLDPTTGESRAIWLDDEGRELIGAAFTVGPEGAYVLTSKAMYMFVLDACGSPTARWRWEYGDIENPDLSTPTLFDEGRLVTFSINHPDGRAELVVMKTADAPMTPEDRLVCRMSLFEEGKSAIQNTVMAYGRSIVAQNNFGGAFYEVGDFEPGLVRIDVREDHDGCDIVWQDDTISSQVPPRLSTGDGHVWLYSHKRGEPEGVHAYYLTALDFDTGRVASEIFVASGERMDNPMLSVDFLPGGVMVGGVRNGIISVCDSTLDDSGTPVCRAGQDPRPADSAGCAGCVSGPGGGHDVPALWALWVLGIVWRARPRVRDAPVS